MPTSPQLDALTRALSAILAGYLIKSGLDESSALAVAGALLSIGVIFWGAMVNRLTALLKSVAAQPEVEKIIVSDPVVAANEPSPKVVAQ